MVATSSDSNPELEKEDDDELMEDNIILSTPSRLTTWNNAPLRSGAQWRILRPPIAWNNALPRSDAHSWGSKIAYRHDLLYHEHCAAYDDA